MKSLAVVNPNSLLTSNKLCIERLNIQGIFNLSIALMEEKEPKFDRQNEVFKDKVLVRKLGFSLNFRDRLIMKNASHYFDNNIESSSYGPIGSEFMGVIEDVGNSVSNLKIGDRVIPNAAYPSNGFPGINGGLPTNSSSRELEVLHFSQLLRIPDHMSNEVGAGFTIGAQTAYGMIRKARINSSDKILITAGSSNTSLFLIQALQCRGVEIHTITTSTLQVEKLKRLGVTHVYLRSDSIFEDRKLLGFFDIIFDPFCDLYLPKVFRLIKIEGRYITCGLHNQLENIWSGENELNATLFKSAIIQAITNNISFIGNCLGSTEDLQQAIADFDKGKLHVIIDSVYSKLEIRAFMDRTFNDPGRLGKVILSYAL